MLIFPAALLLLLHTTPPKKTTLTIDVGNILTLKGQVHLGVFATAAGFPDKAKPAQNKFVKVTGNRAQAVFEVEPGTYAVAIYHDVNDNGKIDKKLFGIPTEPYGFSNNIRPRLSAPSFTDCGVVVGESDKKFSIELK